MDPPVKQKRVLLIRNAYQKDTGGAEQYVFNLAKALLETTYQPIVVTKHAAIHEKCANEHIRSVRGVWHESQEWSRWYYVRYIFTTLWYMWIILTRRIDIVHPQSRDDFVFATRAAFLLRKKVIWTDHADLKYILDRVRHPHPRMQKWILHASKHSSSIICVSQSEKNAISSVAPEITSQLKVVHNGVFRPDQVQTVNKEGFVIGTNARLVASKGIGELIEAFSRIKKKDSELWLLGGLSGNHKKYTALAQKHGVSRRVKFIDYVPNPNDYVAAMDIFVHASYHEAFSLAIIEACMLARPIIATNVGGTPEIISDTNGVLIPPKDVAAITSAIDVLTADPKRAQKLAAKAYKTALQSFDFQKLVESKIVPMYEKM